MCSKEVENLGVDILNESLIDAMPWGTAKILLNDDFCILVASEGYYMLTGYTKEECQGAPVYGKAKNFLIEEDMDKVIRSIEQLKETGNPVSVEYRIRKKDGSIAWNTAFIPNVGEENGLMVIEAVFLDTTLAKEKERRLICLTNNVPGGVVHMKISDQLIVDYANDGFYRMLGYTYEEFMEGRIQSVFSKIIYPDDRERVISSIKECAVSCADSSTTEYRIINKKGEIRWLRTKAGCSDNNKTGNGGLCVEAIFSDITEAKKTELELKLNEERYRIICEYTQDIVIEWDLKKDTIYFSHIFEKKFGYRVPQTGGFFFLLKSDIIFGEDKIKLRALKQKMKDGALHGEAECRIRKSRGDYIWCKISFTNIFNDAGQPDKAVGLISDIDGYKREAAVLHEKAERDLLTGLLNKITTQERIMESLRNADFANTNQVLYLIDLDDFKNINDQLGHAVGDMVLIEVSSRISRYLGSDSIIGRVGGDEYIAFVPNISSKEEMEKIANGLNKAIHIAFYRRGKEYMASGSIGAAVSPEHGTTFKQLYQKADEALYCSKRKGKNQYFFYAGKKFSDN